MQNKDYSISFVRLAAMCLIVSCHVMQGLGSAWAWHLNIGVQVFLVISGWLHCGIKIEDPIGFLRKRAARILIPCYLFLLAVVPLYIFSTSVDLTLRDLRGLFLLRTYPPGLGHLWFVGYILLLYFITPYLSWLTEWLSRGSVWRFCLLSFLVLGLVFVIEFEYHGALRTAIVMCYFVGYLMRAFKDKYEGAAHGVFLRLAILLFALILALRMGLEINPGLKCGFYDAILPFLKCAEGVGLFLLLKSIGTWLGKSTVLGLSDKYSYEIYLCHHVFLVGPLALPLAGGGGHPHRTCADRGFGCDA